MRNQLIFNIEIMLQVLGICISFFLGFIAGLQR